MDRNLLNDATSSDDGPTAGYMLNEIARATTANYQANTHLQEFLLSRLTHKSHNVKWKCLVIIKHVCRAGRAEFKREMARKVDIIKECLQYKGVPDPIRGDEYNRRVREAAKEALDAIFDSQMPVTTSAVAAANRIQGMGNDYVPDSKPKESGGIISSLVTGIQQTILGDGTDTTYVGTHGASSNLRDPKTMAAQMARGDYSGPSGGYSGTGSSGGGYSGGGGGSGMTGMGNPNFRDAREEVSWMQRASAAAASFTGTGGGSGKTHQPTFGSAGSGNGEYNYATNRGSSAYGHNDPAYNPRMTMNSFGGNSSNNSSWQQNQQSSFNQSQSQQSPQPGVSGGGIGKAGGAVSDGTYERGLIDTLCEPGGLKPVPAENKLQEFLIAAVALSPDIVGDCLLDCLQSDQYQTRTKALLVIASLVKARDCAAHADWWNAHSDDVQALLSDSKASVRTTAIKTLRAVGVDVVVGGAEDTSSVRSVSPKPGAYAAPAVNAPAGRTASLLDDFDEPSPAPMMAPAALAVPVPVSAPASVGGSDLFADVSFSGPGSSQPPSSMAPVYNGYPVTPMAPATTTANMGASSLFDGLNVGGGNAGTISGLSSVTLTPVMTPTVNNNHASSQQFNAPRPPIDMLDEPFGSAPMSYSAPPQATPQAPPAPASGSIFDAFDSVVLTASSSASTAPPAPPASSSSAAGASSGFSFLGGGGGGGPPAPAARDLISTVFVEERPKPAGMDAFAQINASLGLVPQHTQQQQQPATGAAVRPMNVYSTGPNAGMGGKGGMQPGMMYGGGGAVASPPAANMNMNMGYGGVNNPNSSVLAPSMLSYNAPRKAIPDAAGPPGMGSSGFSFMGGAPAPGPGNPNNAGANRNPRGPPGAAAGSDSFDFVTQAMRSTPK